MTTQAKDKQALFSGNLEVKKTPQGFVIEHNGNTIELKENETDYLKKALLHAIKERDFAFLHTLLPPSFTTEENIHDKTKKLNEKRILFVSDLPELISQLKSLLKSSAIGTTHYLHYDDKNIFDKDADIVVAHHSSPKKKFFLELNTFCLDNSISFIKTTFTASQCIITPFLLPYESACYNCYILLKSHNHVFDQDTLDPHDLILTAQTKPTELMLHLCASFLVCMLLKFLTAEQFIQDELSEVVFDIASTDISKNPLLKVPLCPACSLAGTKKTK